MAAKLRNAWDDKFPKTSALFGDRPTDRISEFLFYLGAEAVIEILKAAGPDGFVKAVWDLDREADETLQSIRNWIAENLTEGDRFAIELERARRREAKKGG